MIRLVYLAAGSARRFGRNKLLCPMGGRPLYAYGLETLVRFARKSPDRELTVVSRSPEILAAAERAGARAVMSPDSEKGISHTIRAGLAALGEPAPEDWLIFAVADQPFFSEHTLEGLAALRRTGCLGGSAAFGERPGSPTAFSPLLVPELRALDGDRGGRSVLKNHPEAVTSVQVESERELLDVDRPEDAERLFRDNAQ